MKTPCSRLQETIPVYKRIPDRLCQSQCTSYALHPVPDKAKAIVQKRSGAVLQNEVWEISWSEALRRMTKSWPSQIDIHEPPTISGRLGEMMSSNFIKFHGNFMNLELWKSMEIWIHEAAVFFAAAKSRWWSPQFFSQCRSFQVLWSTQGSKSIRIHDLWYGFVNCQQISWFITYIFSSQTTLPLVI